MNLLKRIKSVLIGLEDVISTQHSCLACECEILDGSEHQMCEKCFGMLDKIDGRLCSKCGDVLLDGSLKCLLCNSFNYAFNSSRSIFYYNDVSAKIIKGLKYGGRKYYAKHIAKMMTEKSTIFKNIDFLTFVPISKKRKKIRGFNQAEEIANEISKIVGIPVMNLLVKTKDKKHQAGLSQIDRLSNLKDTFEVNTNVLQEVKGKRVLIIDDVFTTGATLSECSEVLKNAGLKTVKGLTFAKTKLNSIN